MRALSLDKLIMIPDSLPPHKEISSVAPSAEERLRMTELAAREIGAEVSDVEIKRGGRSYTVDTLAELRKLYPEDELWLIMGTDMLLSIEEWHRAEDILKSVRIATAPRRGDDLAVLLRHAEYLTKRYGAEIRVIDAKAIEISSSEIRKSFDNGSYRQFLTRAVCDYIEEKGLYGLKKG